MFDLMAGPWDRFNGDAPFWGTRSPAPGGGYYPEDLTKTELETYLAAHSGEKQALWLEPAAKLLDQAAATTPWARN